MFSNIGDVPLEWNLSWTSEILRFVSPSTSGHLESCAGLGQIELSLNSTPLASRADPYITYFQLNSSSPTPTPFPETSSSSLVVSVLIKATPSAAQSIVTLYHSSSMVASQTIYFTVIPVDVTGMAISDASSAAFNAELFANATAATVACRIVYAASEDACRGECHLPEHVTGLFDITVRDGSNALVGAGSHGFTVLACPPSFWLDPAGSMCKSECVEKFYRESGSNECKLCPSSVECAAGSRISDWVLDAGYWRATDTSIDVRSCRFGERGCPGVTDDTDQCTARGFGDRVYCGCGYVGPTCAVCAPNYFLSWAGNSCQECGPS